MAQKDSFWRDLLIIAIPVALQSLLQSSFSIIDQVMVGQLGEAAISGVGIGGRFVSIFFFSGGAIISAAGILIAQFLGSGNHKSLAKSYHVSTIFSLIVGLIFFLSCLLIPDKIASLYIQDPDVIAVSAEYLRIYSFSFIPVVFINMYSTLMRCVNKASLPMYVSFGGVVLNTILNACFIFGLAGFPKLGAAGVAAASTISMSVSWLVMYFLFRHVLKEKNISLKWDISMNRQEWKSYVKIVLPLFVTELIWVLGENVYGGIYGHLGTSAFTAMTMATTIISLVMGALSGLSQAASIMAGRILGTGDFEKAYHTGVRLIKTGLIFSVVFAVLCALLSPLYASIYQVSDQIRQTTVWLLCVFACYAPIKTLNMVVSGGILRSGGKTQLTLYLDLIGTWCIGVPIGLLTEAMGMPIVIVYAALSIEEVVRLILGLIMFKKKVWIKKIADV